MAILAEQLDLHSRNLQVPIDYRGDTVFELAIVKAIVREGWWWHVNGLSAPAGLDLAAVPILGNLDCVLIKLFSFFTTQAGLVLNLYWLATIPVAGAVAMWSLRRLGIHQWISFVLGILYALSPHIYYRHTAHLMLTHHFIPLIVTLAALLAVDRINLLQRSARYILLASCVLIGFSYVYYAFFSCYLLAIAGVIGFLQRRNYRIIRIAGFALCLVVLSFIGNYFPSFRSWINEPGGRNFLTYKSPAEADLYGLKIRDLITPTSRSPIPGFAAIAARVQAAHFPFDNESRMARMGAVPSLGFLLLLGTAIFYWGPQASATMQLLRTLGELTMGCVLLATVGGFGSLFNALVRPDVRAYNRISPFIIFLCLAGTGVILTNVFVRIDTGQWFVPLKSIILAIVLSVGILDQNEAYILNSVRNEDQEKFYSESQFIAQIEARLPRDAMVYQLPHYPYGDGDTSAARDPRVGLSAFEEPFVLSTSVRWSYPAVSNEAVSFARRMDGLDAPELVGSLLNQGFHGALIDRFGYKDNGEKLLTELRDYLGSEPIRSADKQYVFFLLPKPGEQARLKRIKYPWNRPISFSPGAGAAEYLGEGWSCVGCTDGKYSTMYFNVDPPKDDVALVVHVTPALFGGIRVRPVRVFVNEVKVGQWEIDHADWFSSSIPKDVIKRESPLSLRFELPNAVSPESLGLNGDRRILGVTVDSLVLRSKAAAAGM